MSRRSKEAFVNAAAGELDALATRLDRLRATCERLKSEQRFALERALDDVRGIRNRAGAKLEDVRRASDDAWTTNRILAERALDELDAAVRHMENRVRLVAA